MSNKAPNSGVVTLDWSRGGEVLDAQLAEFVLNPLELLRIKKDINSALEDCRAHGAEFADPHVFNLGIDYLMGKGQRESSNAVLNDPDFKSKREKYAALAAVTTLMIGAVGVHYNGYSGEVGFGLGVVFAGLGAYFRHR